MERKEWTAKYEQVKTSADSAEALHKRNQAAHLSALSEARKREENLKKALAVEKLCVTNVRFYYALFYFTKCGALHI